jgi:hypothetical protein
MQDLTGAPSKASNRMSYLSELRSKRDMSDTASIMTVDEITAEVESRRVSKVPDMSNPDLDDWTKVENEDEDETLKDTDVDGTTLGQEDEGVDVDDELEDEEEEDEDFDIEIPSRTGAHYTANPPNSLLTSLLPNISCQQVDQGRSDWRWLLRQGLSRNGREQWTVDGCQASGAAPRHRAKPREEEEHAKRFGDRNRAPQEPATRKYRAVSL